MKTYRRMNPGAFPPIYRRIYPSGEVVYRLETMVNGKRICETFPTLEKANERGAELRSLYRAEGKEGFELTPELRNQATVATKLLQPYQSNILEATHYYVDHVLKFRTAPTVKEICQKLIEETEKNNRRPNTVRELRIKFDIFCRTFGDRQLSTINLAELTDFIRKPEYCARTQVNWCTKISQIYNFAVRNQWTYENPVKRISRPTVDTSENEIYSPQEALELLQASKAYGLLPAVALGLFAGLRTAELQRLDWSNIRLDEKVVIVGSDVAKRRSRRIVNLSGNLVAILTKIVPQEGRVISDPENYYNRIKVMCRKNKIRWLSNGLRHSFGSYFLARTNDSTKTAHEMGHRNPDILHNHYKTLVTSADAARYWKIGQELHHAPHQHTDKTEKSLTRSQILSTFRRK